MTIIIENGEGRAGHDSGAIQRLDIVGDRRRAPLIIVLPYAEAGERRAAMALTSRFPNSYLKVNGEAGATHR